jgi:prophage maintenance system killer protein
MTSDGTANIATDSKNESVNVADVLDELKQSDIISPRDISQNRLRESPVRLHFHRLEALGLAESVGVDHFRITSEGEEVTTDVDEIRTLYSNFIQKNRNEDRITDLSFLNSYRIKKINMRFFEDENQEYGLVLNSTSETKSRILNQSGNRIYRIIREFPSDIPLVSQCAHWMRAFAGLHWFPDANHRTGMTLLEIILDQNGLDSDPLPGSYRNRVVLRSKIIRLVHIDSTTLRDLWKRDIYYEHWYEYFSCLFYNTRCSYNSSCSLEKLRDTLREARGREVV